MLNSSAVLRSVRPVLRTPSLVTRPLSSSSLFRPSAPRLEASPVAQKPANKNVKEMGKSAVQEARGVVNTVAEAVAGNANDVTSQRAPKENFGAGDMSADIASMASLSRQVPPETIKWGAAGLLPYAGTSLATIHFARQAYQAQTLGKTDVLDPDAALALLQHVTLLQVQYGAIILSFLGAVHWGFEWSKFGGVKGNPRYLLGVAPVLAGWSTLLIPGQLALVGQWAAFFGMWYADQRATTNGWTPKWYSTYRFWLTSLVGGSILVSLAAQGYYSVDPIKTESQLEALKKARPPTNVPEGNELKLGEMKAEKQADEGSEAYVKFVNVEKERKAKEEEEKKQKEEEEQKRKEEEENKKAVEKKKKVQDAVNEQVKKVEEQ
ncbi:hypothetical protein JCM8547_005481 [Rhodosporidiobolus lusitaniae]